jgi:hypothetical protein
MTVYLPCLSYIRMGTLGCSTKIELVKRKLSEDSVSDGKEELRMSYIAELANELSAHATRASRRRDVSGDGDGTEIASLGSLFKCHDQSLSYPEHKTHTKMCDLTYMLSHSRSNSNSLRTSSNGVRGVLDIGSRHDGATGQQQSTADVEFRVWA